jgi:class 3 adenylate cyclase
VTGQTVGVLDVPPIRYAVAPDGANIAYQVVGDGAVDLVHFPTPWAHLEARWEDPSQARFLRRLSEWSRLIIFDKRGYGLSERVADVPTLDRQMDDVLAVMDAAGSESAAAYGFFDGALLAALFAAAHPERLHTLVAAGMPVRFICSPPEYPWGFTDEFIDQTMEEINDSFTFELMLNKLFPSRVGDRILSATFERLARLSAGPTGVQRFVALMRQTDIRAVLPAVQARTLLIAHEEDDLFPPEQARFVTAQMPDAAVATLPGRDSAFWGTDLDVLADKIETFVTGSHPTPKGDRVLLTALFTDIVRSTERAVELGDKRWRELLQRHHDSITDAVHQSRGVVRNWTGDGVLATFDAPGRAIACAQRIRTVVGELGLEIRAGLHTGEVEVAGADVGGIAIHVASRVLAAAGAGEVLVSSVVPPLVAGSGTAFDDRGATELKGIPGQWHLFSVRD